MRKSSVGFHPAAAREYADALEWYAARGEALGSVFQQEVERAIRLVAASPERWPRFGVRHRRLLLRRFPYFLIYLRHQTQIFIVAVAHARRKPRYWRRRRMPE